MSFFCVNTGLATSCDSSSYTPHEGCSWAHRSSPHYVYIHPCHNTTSETLTPFGPAAER